MTGSCYLKGKIIQHLSVTAFRAGPPVLSSEVIYLIIVFSVSFFSFKSLYSKSLALKQAFYNSGAHRGST